MNGAKVESETSITEAFRSFAGRKPFLFELERNDGSVLTVGFGGSYGCVQHSKAAGSPPYLMALNDEDVDVFAFGQQKTENAAVFADAESDLETFIGISVCCKSR